MPALPSVADTMRWRQRHGISAAAFVFGVFGYLRESGRLFSVLRAFERLHRGRPETALIVAGDFVSSDLERAAAPLVAAPGVVRLPWQPESGFWQAAAAVDACISLRSPAAGETSGIAVRLMGIGKAVLLSDTPENSRYPDETCIRIPAGVPEREALWQHMVLLTSLVDLPREIGLRGAGFVSEHHSVAAAAEQYWNTLCEYRS
jgi:glycosyltransferase involved in cell wall biosynthesis